MLGKVVKRERPEKKPISSMIVNVKLRLNATSNLGKGGGGDGGKGGREDMRGRGGVMWLALTVCPWYCIPQIQAQLSDPHMTPHCLPAMIRALLWATMELTSHHSMCVISPHTRLTLDQYSMIFNTR